MSGRDGVVSVDQAPIKGSRRSNPATYTGLLEPIRKAFAKANGVKPAVLAMSVEEAKEFFGAGEAQTPPAHEILERLADVGLGYLSLGQPPTTPSGGERQLLKLATHIAGKRSRAPEVYVLDEPTTDLHLADGEHLAAYVGA